MRPVQPVQPVQLCCWEYSTGSQAPAGHAGSRAKQSLKKSLGCKMGTRVKAAFLRWRTMKAFCSRRRAVKRALSRSPRRSTVLVCDKFISPEGHRLPRCSFITSWYAVRTLATSSDPRFLQCLLRSRLVSSILLCLSAQGFRNSRVLCNYARLCKPVSKCTKFRLRPLVAAFQGSV